MNQLAITLTDEQEDHIKAATVWALGQIGRHTPEHAKAIAALRGSANKEQKGIEKYSPEVRLPSRARTTAARRPSKHSQTRRCAVQQGKIRVI